MAVSTYRGSVSNPSALLCNHAGLSSSLSTYVILPSNSKWGHVNDRPHNLWILGLLPYPLAPIYPGAHTTKCPGHSQQRLLVLSLLIGKLFRSRHFRMTPSAQPRVSAILLSDMPRQYSCSRCFCSQGYVKPMGMLFSPRRTRHLLILAWLTPHKEAISLSLKYKLCRVRRYSSSSEEILSLLTGHHPPVQLLL